MAAAVADYRPATVAADKIKKSEGETFINILVRRRMETAQTLLLTTDLQIQEIARRCGYTDHTCDAFFRCRIANAGAVRPADDAADLRWIAPEALRPEDFGLGSVRRGVARLLQEFL